MGRRAGGTNSRGNGPPPADVLRLEPACRNPIRLILECSYENFPPPCARALPRRARAHGRGRGRLGLAGVARPGQHRRVDRDRAAELVVAGRRRTSPGSARTAAVRRLSCSATTSTCRTPSGAGATEQERLMCFNADTGKLLWEHRYNIFTSDVPAHRIAWASPAVDPATGQRLRDQRQRPADVAVARTASCSGNARSPRSSACGRRTAGACRRRSSTATR